MTYLSLLVIGTAPEQLDAVLDPFLHNPKDKRYANFTSMDEEIREMFETGMVRPENDPEGTPISVRQHYGNDIDAFITSQYADVEKSDNGVFGQYQNPNGKYSYYVLGGRNNGFFQLREGGIGTLTERHSRYDPSPDPNTADITTLQYWDRELQAKIQHERAVQRHRYFYSQLGNIRLPVSNADWPHFFKNDSPLHGYDLKDIYTQAEAEYAAAATQRANVSFAVLKDGIIYERQCNGRPGTPEEIEEFQSWQRTFSSLFENLAPDTPLIALTAYE